MYPISKLSPGLYVAAIFLIAFSPECYGADLRGQSRLSALAEPHIVGGKDTPIEEVPYQVSLERYAKHTCGAAIISDTWVITAAHCVHSSVNVANDKRIRAGITYVVPWIGWFSGSSHDIQKTVVHPQFNEKLVDDDVALLKVSKFDFSPRVQPIPVLVNETDINFAANATVSGWGEQVKRNWWPWTHLKSTEMSLITRDQCIDITIKERLGYYVSRNMICARGFGGGDTAHGDSGGPLVQNGKLIGLVSWGMGDNTLPSVYTNLPRYTIREFISNHTGV